MKGAAVAVEGIVGAASRTPEQGFEDLGVDAGDSVAEVAARNPDTSSGRLRVLATHESPHIRFEAARNPSTPAEALDDLADDVDRRTRYGVAANPSTSATTLARMVDAVLGVGRRGLERKERVLLNHIARNTHTSVDTLRVLKDCDIANVRVNVALHPNATENIHRRLMDDLNAGVVVTVAEYATDEDVLDEMAKTGNVGLQWPVADNPHTHADTLAMLAESEVASVRRGVAAHPNTPIGVLETLAEDLDEDVRRAVFTNVNY